MDNDNPNDYSEKLLKYISFFEDIRQIYYRGDVIHPETAKYDLKVWNELNENEQRQFDEWDAQTETYPTIFEIHANLALARHEIEQSKIQEKERLARRRSYYQTQIISQIKILADKLGYSVLTNSIRPESENTCDAWYSGEPMKTGDIRILLREKQQ